MASPLTRSRRRLDPYDQEIDALIVDLRRYADPPHVMKARQTIDELEGQAALGAAQALAPNLALYARRRGLRWGKQQLARLTRLLAAVWPLADKDLRRGYFAVTTLDVRTLVRGFWCHALAIGASLERAVIELRQLARRAKAKAVALPEAPAPFVLPGQTTLALMGGA